MLSEFCAMRIMLSAILLLFFSCGKKVVHGFAKEKHDGLCCNIKHKYYEKDFSNRVMKVDDALVEKMLADKDSLKSLVLPWVKQFGIYEMENEFISDPPTDYNCGLVVNLENVDEDPEAEVFLTVNLNGWWDILYILDKMGHGWYCVGRVGVGRAA